MKTVNSFPILNFLQDQGGHMPSVNDILVKAAAVTIEVGGWEGDV